MSLERVLQEQFGGVHGLSEVVVVAIELGGMTGSADVLVHGLQLEIGMWEEIVDSDGGHVEDAVLRRAVAIHEVVASCELKLVGDEIACLSVGSPVVEALADLLTLRESDMHVVGFGADVPAVFEHREFESCTEVVRAFAFTLYVFGDTETEEHFVFVQTVGIALCGWHHATGHPGEAGTVEERGDMPVVAECLAGCIDGGTCAVEDSDLVAKLFPEQAMQFDTEVETGSDGGGDGIEGVWHDGCRCERCGYLGQECFAEGGEVGMGEGCLELTDLDGKLLLEFDVEPCLLQEVATRGSGVHREVESDTAKSLSRESEHGVGDGKTCVGDVVLVVGFVQTFVVVVVEVGRCLDECVGLEDEVALLAGDGKTFGAID